jgi:2-dehydro-3-deoxyphosphogluconate aldolase/(4S)-4-hydroxy-2-oxoglutarate aldolase
MSIAALYSKLKEFRVVPVIAIEDVASALPLADALIEGRLPVAEITFRTAAAAAVISKLKKERPELLVGAGTVLTVDNLKRAKDCGAEFAVAPGFNPTIVEESLKIDLPFSPGIMTPSDIEEALNFNLKLLKFFPAEAAGGLTFLKSLSAPYGHTGVKFIPTGGINLQNLKNYLSYDAVLSVGGTWIAKKEDISVGNWKKIKDNCDQLSSI